MPPKLNIGAMSQFVIHNPFTTAAAVFAPIFAQNEDRGYFRTALITTPVIFATGQAVPKLFGGVRDLARGGVQAQSILQKAEKWTRFEQPNFHDLNVLFKDKNASNASIDRAVSQYLVAERRGSRDFLKEQKLLSRLWTRKFVKTSDLIGKAGEGDLKSLARVAEIEALQSSKGKLITNALHVARRSSLTPREWATETAPVWEENMASKVFSNEEMTAMFDQYSSRPEFVKTLRNRLREVNRLGYSGTTDVFTGPPGKTVSSFPIDFDWDEPARAALAKQAPEAYQYLEQAQKMGHIKDVIAMSDDVVKGKVGRVLRVKITRPEKGNLKEFEFPIVDTDTGTVRLSGNSIGVGDYVIDQFQQAHRIDTWVSKLLVEGKDIPIDEEYPGGPSLNNEVASHAYWFAGDPMDTRRMTELQASGEEGAGAFTAQARKLRSYAAKYTKLPMFLNSKGESVSYRELSPAEQQQIVRKTLNSNRFINMSSEAGTYEGRFVLREASLLSPYGAPSAEKQDSLWRSVTKEFQLRAPDGLPQEARPMWRSTAWESLTGNAQLPGARLSVASVDPQVRTALLNEMKAAGRSDVVSHLGRMGETGLIMNEAYSNNFTVEGISKYNVNELGVKVGDVVTPDTVMGFNNYERVLPKHLGTVTDVAHSDTGFVIDVRHELPLQGAKFDTDIGIKGMVAKTLPADESEQLRQIINDYYSRTGAGDFIPKDTAAFAPAEYLANKAEPTSAYLDIAGDLVNRLKKAGAGDVSKNYLSRMESELGTTFQGGQLVIDAAKIQSLKDVDAAERLRTLSSISEDFFRQAGDAIKTAGGYNDPVLTAYVTSGKELGDWMLKNQLSTTLFTWDHSLVNAPRFASITHDISSYMALGQNFAGIKAIRNRLQTNAGGDPRKALDFMKYVMGGSYDKELGMTIPIKEAFTSRGNLNKASDRAGTIFDPSIAAYQESFRVDLGEGRFLPVPGTSVYGAEAAMYEPGKYQTRRWQHTLQDLAFETNPEKRASLETNLVDQYKELFGTGKGGVLRPHQYDPLSVAGVFSTIAEEENPFTAYISKDLAEKVRSKRLRDTLLEGGEVFGALHRQPTNQMLYMKYKVDEAISRTLDVGVAERISRAFIGDQDKDTAYALLFDASIRAENGKAVVANAANRLEADAAMEAYEAIQGGRQLRNLEAWESVKGTPEVSNRMTGFTMKKLSSRAEKFASKVENRVGVAINRMAGASIGPFSNALTEITEQMVRNPEVIRNPELAARLSAMMFDIRQAPITARKSSSFSLEVAMGYIDRLKKAVAMSNPDASTSALHGVLMGLGNTLNPDFSGTPEYEYLSGQGLEDIQVWARGRTGKAALLKQALTSTVQQDVPFVEQFAAENLPRIFEDVEEVLGPVHGGMTASAKSASRLGMIAESLAEAGRARVESATGKIGDIFSRHGKALAFGLGSLAALGIAMTPRTAPVASFSRVSGNQYRPEDRMGVADNIPGEPVPGQMAPSSPPRRMEIAQPGVRTAVVASMGQTSDLSVKMRATDRDRAAETARLLSQIPGSGDTNVTINYRDRTKLRSLRTREKIREIR